jgi:hypothetical protein
MKTEIIRALKTLGGALHYSITRYEPSEAYLDGRDWELFVGNLNLPVDVMHGIEMNPNDFTIYTKYFKLLYRRNGYNTDQRRI